MSIPIYITTKELLPSSVNAIGNSFLQNWVKASGLENGTKTSLICPNEQGGIHCVLTLPEDITDMYAVACLATSLPKGDYHLVPDYCGDEMPDITQLALGWYLGQYHYSRYVADERHLPHLVINEATQQAITPFIEASTLVRDLINTPPNDLGPHELVQAALGMAKRHNARAETFSGDDIKSHYPAVYAVGKASVRAPEFVSFVWGEQSAPKVTLVGKGVCFDSGGLDIKNPSNMKLMKKDMGGAAATLGLAHLIMAHNLPVRLQVLIPAVENSVSGNAFRTSDVINTRHGMTVEIGNTDAEGRLILCDALTRACEEEPEIIIDCATLTGAARVALGTDVPACFCNNDAFIREVLECGIKQQDVMWQLPLHQPYAKKLKSDIADTNHISQGGYGGAITAALFLEKFITTDTIWMHIDMMAWNLSSSPGRPRGGEAMGIRAVFAALKARYKR